MPIRERGAADGKQVSERTPCGAAFTGQWRDEDGAIIAIEETAMQGPDGTLRVVRESWDACSVHIGGEVHRAVAVAGGRLLWSDGGVWLRASCSRSGHGGEPAPSAKCEQRRAEKALDAAAEAPTRSAPAAAKMKKTDKAGLEQLEALGNATCLAILEELLESYKDAAFQKKLHCAWDSAAGSKAKQERARKMLCWKAHTPIMRRHRLLASCLEFLQSRACSGERAASPEEEEVGRSILWHLDPDLQTAGPLRPSTRAAAARKPSASAPAGQRAQQSPPGLPAVVSLRFFGGLSGELLCKHQAACSDRVRDVKGLVGQSCGIPAEQQRLLVGQRLLHNFETIGDVVGDLQGAGAACSASEPVDVLVVRLDPERAGLLEDLEQGRTDLCELQEELRDDAESVLAAARWRLDVLELASERLRGRRDFFLAAVKEQPGALRYATAEMKRDSALVLAAVLQEPGALRFAGREPSADAAVVLRAVERDGLALEFASWELRAQEDVVLAAVRQNGGALQFADVTVIGKSEIVAAAIRQDRAAIRFAADDLRSDPSFWPTMEQVGLFEDPEMEDLLWIDPKAASDLGRRGKAIFADARFPMAFKLGHVAGAFSVPGGRSTLELGDIEETEVFSALVKSRDSALVVYCDDGSDLGLCTYLARRFRTHPWIKAHKVLRLRGGLNLWAKSGLPVESGQ